MRVLVVAEYYPRAYDPVLGVWSHRQTLAARAAGAEVEVLVLHRPIPPLATLRAGDLRHALKVISQPARDELDGVPVRYLRYLSPPRSASYGAWGAWAAPALARALKRIRERFPFQLIHAHYAVPAGDAVRRAAASTPLIVSVHGHDVQGAGAGSRTVRQALARADLVLANSTGTARRCLAHGASRTQVVHLGTDLPDKPAPRPRPPTLVTVAHLAARKRHADVIEAVALLRDRHPTLRYVIIGDGPEREPLRALAASLDLADRVELRGQLPPAQARASAQTASLFVMPSVDEAFGVAYVEAMAGGVPALGCAGEDGPEEIAASGEGIALVPPRDVPALAQRIDTLLCTPGTLDEMGRKARATVEAEFTWPRCGEQTVAAYQSIIGAA